MGQDVIVMVVVTEMGEMIGFCFGHMKCQIMIRHPHGAVEWKSELKEEVQAGEKHLRVFNTETASKPWG